MQVIRRSSATTIDWLDRIAVFGSATCMVHCLALPLLVAALPALSTVATVPASFHRWVLAFTVPLAAIALLQGRRRHGEGLPLLVGATGIVLLAIAALLLSEGKVEVVTTVAGSLLVGWAHLANWRMRRRCRG